MILQHESFINFLSMLILKKLFFDMNDVHIEQSYDMLHVDLFNNIYQKSNNDKIHTNLTPFLDDRQW